MIMGKIVLNLADYRDILETRIMRAWFGAEMIIGDYSAEYY
jgi:hypothetical protein